MFWKMAWRNLWRNKRRTLITVISVAFGVWLSITFTSTAEFSYKQMVDAAAKMGSGHLTIQAAGYQENPKLKLRLPDAVKLAETLDARPEYAQVVSRTSGYAMFATARKSLGAAFLGVDPKQEEPETNMFIKNLKEGELFKSANSRGALIGSGMAKKLSLKLGSKLVYTVTDIHGDMSSGLVKIRGIFETGVDQIDSRMVVLARDALGKVLGYAPGEATQVSIYLDNQYHAAQRQADLLKEFDRPDAEFLTWRETQPDMVGLIAVDATFNYIIQGILGMLIAVGIFNTLLMSVMERKREFGVMMAVGLSPGSLFRLVLAESACIGAIGLLLGLTIGLPWFAFLKYHGIDLSNMIEQTIEAGGVPMELVISASMQPHKAIIILICVGLLTLAAGMVPAWKAGHIAPVESIRDL